MEFRPKLKAVVVGVGMALFAGSAMAGSWGAPGQGDSGQGVDTVMGNGLNVTGLDVTRPVDTEGLGPYRSPVARTPTGQMYSVPWAEPASAKFHGSVEVGVLQTTGDSQAAKLIEYRDLSDGVILNNFNVGGDGDNHEFFNVFGGGVGRDDQYYGAELGVYNNWRVRGFYNQTPHVFSTTARLIWSGAGSSYMALKPGLQSTGTVGTVANPNAATINATLRAVVNSSPDDTIKLTRDKGGIRFDKNLPDNWSFYVSATTEKRTGDRTWGQTGGGFPGAAASNANGTNGQPIQMVEPIDYRTSDIRTGLSWAGDHDALNLSVAVSLFQDAIKRVLWENPDVSPINNGFVSAGNQGLGAGIYNRHVQSFTTPPDNQAYYFNADYMHAFDSFWNAKLTSSLSYGVQNQDDVVQPYTSATGQATAVTGAGTTGFNPQTDMAYWNSAIGPNGLPTTTRATSGLKSLVTNWAESLSLQPTDALSLNAKFNYYNYDQHNDYLACNPSLAAAKGVTCDPASSVAFNAANGYYPQIYGYLVEDGNAGQAAGGLATAISGGLGQGGATRSFRSTFRQTNTSFGGDYKLSATQSVNLNVEEENVWRKERERERTDEAKVKIGYVNRDLGGGTLRTAYEYDRRTGSDWKVGAYNYSECAAFTLPGGYALCAPGIVSVAGVPAATSSPPEGGKHDLNDRNQHILTLRYNKALTDTLDMMVTGRSKTSFYPNPGEPVGLDERRENTLSVDVNWQPTTATALYGYLTAQKASQSQESFGNFYSTCTQATYLAGTCSAVAGGPNSIFGNLATAAMFGYKNEDNNQILGLGFSHAAAMVRFDGNYQYTRTRSPVSYASWTAAGPAAGTPAAFPDMVYDRQQLNLSITVPLDSNLALRGMYLYDKADVADWHYDGLNALSNATGAGRYYVDSGPAQDYKSQTLGLMLQYKM